MKQKFLCYVLSLILLVGMLPTPALALRGAPTVEEFTGSGTEADPYCIESLSDLELLRDKANAGEVGAGEWFQLYVDINMNRSYGPNRGENGTDRSWTPIGETQPFSGTFDGNGHTITGLYINVNDESRESLYNRALFGHVGETGIVKNISVEGSVSAPSEKYTPSNVAGVVGSNKGTLENCHSNVDVVGKIDVGGVAGYNGGIVKNCSNRGKVTAGGGTSYDTGGIVGLNANDGTVENCYNTGAVSGVEYVGGVVGKNAYHSEKMVNCYNTGAVTGNTAVGGIAGLNEKSTWGTTVMENCFNTGTVTGGSFIGGAIGYGDGAVTKCYYLATCGAGGARGESKTAAEFETLAALLGDSFEDSEFLGHPILKSNFQGYLIPDLAALERCRDFVNAGKFPAGETFVLTADIDMSGSYGNGKASWTPIGTDSQPFVGTFNGGGRQITGLYLYNDTDNFSSKGLFGTVGQDGEGSTIQNLGVSGSITASTALNGGVGGIVGRLIKGGVRSCHYAGSITSGGGNTGGLVGSIGNGSVTHCYNTGNIEGPEGSMGGIVGFIDIGSAESCYNTGTITLTGVDDSIGPVVGAGSDRIAASNCYYLDTCGVEGAGEKKTAAEFASGEIAHLLQPDWGGLVWGQALTGDGKENFPVLTDDFSKAVYLVTFKNGDETVSEDYVNFEKTASQPSADPVKTGYAFVGWYTQAGTNGDQFTAASPVQEDTTLYAQWKHLAPAVPAIDYEKELLATTADMEYSIVISGRSALTWKSCKADMALTDLGWDGSEDVAVKLRTAATTGYHASNAIDLTISARPAAPSVSAVSETADGKNDGKITDVSAAMEYKLSTASNWTPCGGTEVTDLAPGAYQVRTKAVTAPGSEAFASAAASVTIGKGTTPQQPSPPAADGPQPCPRDETCPISKFTDADPAAWYHDGVHYCLENSLMTGYGHGKFGPDNKLTRAQLTQMLYNNEGRPGVSSDSGFVDVAENMWYAKAISWAAENDIVAGYGGKRFGPDDLITREQLATILWRYAGSPAVSGNLDGFTDGSKTSAWAVSAMQWAVAEGIMNGNGNGTITPTGRATRAEVATMMKNYCEKK